jgi:hypothetical protein
MNRDRRNRLLVAAVAGMWLVAVSALAAFYSPKVIAIAVPWRRTPYRFLGVRQ